tara:strand:+ start:407 stop:913 length:507 start_codon:yes stop_codon:yes gene_type:complete
MEQNVDKKIDFKSKVISFYSSNKVFVYSFICIIFLILIFSTFLINNKNEQNKIIAEKYIEAGIYLASDKKEQSINIFEEIILSNNKFYSVLALNTILEKNLVSDKDKILEYFKLVEKNVSKEQKDLVVFKKALYLMKAEDVDKGNSLLKTLIDNDSPLKSLAEEVVIK